jgi:hypothetical protein
MKKDEERYHRRQVRFHLRKLGVDPDKVAEMFPQVAAGKPGKARKGNDEAFLEALEHHVREWQRQTKQKRRRPVLQAIASGFYRILNDDQRRAAVSADALADRWEKKLRKGRYDKRKFETLKRGHVLTPFLQSLFPQ